MPQDPGAIDDTPGKSSVERRPSRLRSLDPSVTVAVLVVAYVFGAALTWAMITPMGAAPDEPSHVAYAAAVVRGDLGTPVPGGDETRQRLVMVKAPQWVNTFTSPPRTATAFNYPCFATVVFRTADCAPDLSGSTAITEVPTTVGRYPPLFHAVVGLPTLVLSGTRAVYAMRIVAAGLAAAGIGLGLALASPSRRFWLALATMVAFTPTAAHLAGSINPSGLEIAAATGLGAGLMGITADRSPRPWIITALAGLSMTIAWSRPLGYLTLVAVIAAAAMVNGRELRRWIGRSTRSRLLVATGPLVAFGTAIVYRIGWGLPAQAASAADPANGSTLFAPTSLGTAVDAVEQHLIDWSLDFVGRFGWSDHAAPGSVLFTWTLLVLILAFFVLLGIPRRDRIALTIVGAGALIVAPLLAISRFINDTAYEARYHLPLAALIVIALGAMTARMGRSKERRIARAVLRWGATLGPPLMLVASAASVHRYAFGTTAQLADLGDLIGGGAAWLPPRKALLAASIGIVVAVVASAALAVSAWRGRAMDSEHDSHPATQG